MGCINSLQVRDPKNTESVILQNVLPKQTFLKGGILAKMCTNYPARIASGPYESSFFINPL